MEEKKTNNVRKSDKSRQFNLIESTIIIGIGYIIPALANLLVLPIYTEALTNEQYGIYDLLLVIVSLVVPIILVRLDAGIFRFIIIARNNDDEIRKIVSSVMSIVMILPILLFPIFLCLLTKFSIADRIYMALYVYFSALYSTLGYLCRGLGNNRLYSKVVCIQSVSTAITAIIFVRACNWKLHGVFISIVISTLVALVYGFGKLRIWRMFSVKYFSKKIVKEILEYSAPMVPNNISMWVVNTSDRLLITGMLGVGANGIYAIANKFPTYLSQIMGVLNMSWQENAAVYVEDEDASQYFSGITMSILNILMGMSALLLGMVPFLFKILVRQDYSEAFKQVPILILGLLLSCMTSHYGSIYLALRETKIIGITSVAGAIVNILINVLFIKKIGLYAASISTVVSFGIVFIIRSHILKRFICIKVPIGRLWKGIIVLVLMSVLYYYNNFWTNILNFVIAVVFAIVINKNVLQILTKKK